jgi:hypothetical protein
MPPHPANEGACTVQTLMLPCARLRREPPRVRPAYPLHHLLLPIQPRLDVDQLVNLLQKLVEDAPRKHPAGFLSQQVDFAQQQPVVSVVDLSKLVRRGSNEYAVDVSVSLSVCASWSQAAV